jgi:hypothetical protein
LRRKKAKSIVFLEFGFSFASWVGDAIGIVYANKYFLK